jgi:hypothetical protein
MIGPGILFIVLIQVSKQIPRVYPLSQSGASDLELDAYGKTTYKYEKTGKY